MVGESICLIHPLGDRVLAEVNNVNGASKCIGAREVDREGNRGVGCFKSLAEAGRQTKISHHE